jgi:hypothetical protein
MGLTWIDKALVGKIARMFVQAPRLHPGRTNLHLRRLSRELKPRKLRREENDSGMLSLYRTLHWQLDTFAAMFTQARQLQDADSEPLLMDTLYAFLLTTSAGGVYSTFPVTFTLENFHTYIKYLACQRPATNWCDFFTPSSNNGFDDIKPIPASRMPFSAEEHRHVLEVSNITTACCMGRKTGLTEDSRICLVPGDTHKGDYVAIFFGVNVPFIMQKRGDD